MVFLDTSRLFNVRNRTRPFKRQPFLFAMHPFLMSLICTKAGRNPEVRRPLLLCRWRSVTPHTVEGIHSQGWAGREQKGYTNQNLRVSLCFQSTPLMELFRQPPLSQRHIHSCSISLGVLLLLQLVFHGR